MEIVPAKGPISGATRTQATDAVTDEGLRTYMQQVYNYMGAGLAVTGVVAYFTADSGMYASIASTPRTATSLWRLATTLARRPSLGRCSSISTSSTCSRCCCSSSASATSNFRSGPSIGRAVPRHRSEAENSNRKACARRCA